MNQQRISLKIPKKWDLLILSVLLSAGLIRLFREEITALLGLTAGLFGKNFSNLSAPTQTTAFFLAGGLLCCLLFAVLRRVPEGNNQRAVIIVCLAVLVLLTAILCFEQIIRRDDYWEIHDAQMYGFPDFLIYECTNFNGRFLSWSLKSLYKFIDPQTFIRISLFLNLLLLASGCTLLTDRLLSLYGGQASKLTKTVFGTMTALGLVFMSTNIWEVWLWGAGTFIYGLAITLAIFVLVLYIDAVRGNPRYLPTLFIVTCACGASELVTASVCAFGLGILLLNRLFGERKWNKALILFTLWSWVCTIAELSLSGSVSSAVMYQSSRQTSALADQKLIIQFIGFLPTAVKTLWGYLLSRKNYLLLFGLMSLVFGAQFKDLKVPGKALTGISLLLILTAGGILVINTALSYTPARVVSIPLDWVYLILSGSCFILGTKLNLGRSTLVPALCAVILCLHLGAFFRENIVMLNNNRLGWEYRDAQLKAEDGSEPVTTCALHVPGSVRLDLSDDPDYEFNIVTAYYYDLPAVTATEFCPPITE